jgi:Legume-like lectin family
MVMLLRDGLCANVVSMAQQHRMASKNKQATQNHMAMATQQAKASYLKREANAAMTADREEHEHGEYLAEMFSLRPPFPFGRVFTLPNYKYYGSAVVTENYVRLTPDRQSKKGSVWGSVPSYLREWEAIVELKIGGVGRSTYGEGLAFWYSNTPRKDGDAYGSAESWHGLGVFVDTYDNDAQGDTPLLYAAWNTNTFSFNHALEANGPGVLGSCRLAEPLRNQNEPTRLVVSHSRAEQLLTVRIQFANGRWQKCIESPIDIPVARAFWFGASAQTGQVADNHDILSLSVYNLAPLNEKTGNKRHDHYEETMPEDDVVDSGERPSVAWTIIKYIGIGLIAFAVIVGIIFAIYHLSGKSTSHERQRRVFFNK